MKRSRVLILLFALLAVVCALLLWMSPAEASYFAGIRRDEWLFAGVVITAALAGGAAVNDFREPILRFYGRYQHHPQSTYTANQTRRWLAYLASCLAERGQTVYFIEQTQPDWLGEKLNPQAEDGWALKWLERWVGREQIVFDENQWSWTAAKKWAQRRSGEGVFVGLVFGLIYGAVNGLVEVLFVGLVGGLTLRLIYLLIYGLAVRLVSRDVQNQENPTVGIWHSVTNELGKLLVWGLVSGLIYGLIVGLAYVLSFGLILGIVLGIVYSLVFRLIYMLVVGLGLGRVEMHDKPNQGIWRSLINGLGMGLIFGIVVGLTVGFIGDLAMAVGSFFTMTGKTRTGLDVGLIMGLIGGLFGGVGTGLDFGLRAFIRHFIVRWLLARYDYLPFQLVPFLAFATERQLLRREGGGYSFVHPTVMKHFAEEWKQSYQESP